MRPLACPILIFLTIGFAGSSAHAQDPPPRIGPWVVDVHASIPSFPNDSQELADSRSVNLGSLPGRGWGAQLGAHFYFLHWKALTVGVGGELMVARATSTPAEGSTGLVPMVERVVTASPQLSFNFGTGHGWSYLSGGIGRSVWALHETGLEPSAADVEPLVRSSTCSSFPPASLSSSAPPEHQDGPRCPETAHRCVRSVRPIN